MSTARIMVVEDEFIEAKCLKKSLENLGYSVSAIVSSGEKAIEKAEQDKPDLVLMDIELKGSMDGIEAADRILSHFYIPIIYLTAFLDKRLLERAKKTEPYGYLLKPIKERDLHSNIAIALYKHEIEEEREELSDNIVESFTI